MKNIIASVRKPYLETISRRGKPMYVLLESFISVVTIICIRNLIKVMYVKVTGNDNWKEITRIITDAIFQIFDSKGIIGVFLLICLLGPVAEETICRLGLSFKKNHVYISIICFVLYLPFLFILNYVSIILAIVVSILLVFFTYKKITQDLLDIIKEKYGVVIFHIIAFAFAILHLKNLSPLKAHLFIVYIIYLLPMLSFSYISSYIRLQIGFAYSVGFHIFFNSIFFLFMVKHVM